MDHKSVRKRHKGKTAGAYSGVQVYDGTQGGHHGASGANKQQKKYPVGDSLNNGDNAKNTSVPQTGQSQPGRGGAAGRGRGRDVGNSAPPVKNAWMSGPPLATGQLTQDKPPVSVKSRAAASNSSKFEDASSEIRASLDRYLEATGTEFIESSSDEDELNDNEILKKTFSGYVSMTNGSGGIESERTSAVVNNVCQSRTNICLICIETVKRADPIWNCKGCHCILHLNCIQKWAKDGAMNYTPLSEQNFPNKLQPWYCPKCRYEYSQSEYPAKYLCYCAKKIDPQFDPWLVPHSCGQSCGRPLQPNCGHECLLLCHPGPCPPCPKTVQLRCYCGQSRPVTRRCSNKEWSCNATCSKLLECSRHRCQTPCHPGECSPCDKMIEQECDCGGETGLKPCRRFPWKCGKVCANVLSCGKHLCEKICHSDECGDCPRAGVRFCPCNITRSNLPCTVDVPTCGDTCNKELDCGRHNCEERCHYGPCSKCRQMIRKRCQCGQKDKNLPCSGKDFTCDSKCSRFKDCARHVCKKKCCKGDCPPCDQICGRNLSCGNHKCPARCHNGMCYPCPGSVKVKCKCSTTVISVPCGRERVTKPPRCAQLCQKASDCHHQPKPSHRCHFGLCPPCKKKCAKNYPRCKHSCPETCHSALWEKVGEETTDPTRLGKSNRRLKKENDYKMNSLPCPPCVQPVPVQCYGKHEEISMPCSSAGVYTCSRRCKRRLLCTNHTCQQGCHTVTEATDNKSAGRECDGCEERCSKRRPADCKHPCTARCHPGPCTPCVKLIRMSCHCNLVQLHIDCGSWCNGDKDQKERLKSCNGQCPRQLKCGHRCGATCHSSKCDQNSCVKKIAVFCVCKKSKRRIACSESKSVVVPCTPTCKLNVEAEKGDNETPEFDRESVKVENSILETTRHKNLIFLALIVLFGGLVATCVYMYLMVVD